jgi:hypothetical protein
MAAAATGPQVDAGGVMRAAAILAWIAGSSQLRV